MSKLLDGSGVKSQKIAGQCCPPHDFTQASEPGIYSYQQFPTAPPNSPKILIYCRKCGETREIR